MEAVAGYLRGLREVQGISQTQVAATVGKLLKRDVQSTTIWRIETAKSQPGGDMLIALLDTLGGSVRDLAELMSTEADAAAGRAAAETWFRESAMRAAPTDRQAVAERLRQMAVELEAGQASGPPDGGR